MKQKDNYPFKLKFLDIEIIFNVTFKHILSNFLKQS